MMDADKKKAEDIYNSTLKMSATKGTVLYEIGRALEAVRNETVDEILRQIPTKREALEAADKFLTADHCRAAFYKGTRWLSDKIEEVKGHATKNNG